ncbi:MAG: phosphoesterase [Dissulfurimicrobium sp.]|uniref:phosphoesterase n=1 Tax=Dissulfurimicrobium sp. TaxID=2022436 RepID=UPI0040494F85
MDRDQEKVFCVRRNDLETLFGSPMPNGALKGPLIEDILRFKAFFLPRNQVEHNFDYKQIIPYQVFHSDKRFFVYRRGEQIGEGRLTGRLSIGIGGHINIMDTYRSQDSSLSFYRKALIRERVEELNGFNVVSEVFLGWINDDIDPVGKVHLGAVHLCEVARPDKVDTKAGEDIHLVGWWTKEDILAKRELFESWSILAIHLF